MKKYLLLLVFVPLILYPQQRIKVGDLSSPYATTGWDTLYGRTQYFNLPIYQLLSNPGGWININQRMVDSLLYKLIVYTDTTQMIIQDDTLVFSNDLSGIDEFTGTATTDTLLISGIDAGDVFIVTIRDAVATANDILSVFIEPNKVIIKRPSGGTSGLKYNWLWIKRR